MLCSVLSILYGSSSVSLEVSFWLASIKRACVIFKTNSNIWNLALWIRTSLGIWNWGKWRLLFPPNNMQFRSACPHHSWLLHSHISNSYHDSQVHNNAVYQNGAELCPQHGVQFGMSTQTYLLRNHSWSTTVVTNVTSWRGNWNGCNLTTHQNHRDNFMLKIPLLPYIQLCQSQ